MLPKPSDKDRYTIEKVKLYANIFLGAWKTTLAKFRDVLIWPKNESDLKYHIFHECMKILEDQDEVEIPCQIMAEVPFEGKKIDLVLGDFSKFATEDEAKYAVAVEVKFPAMFNPKALEQVENDIRRVLGYPNERVSVVSFFILIDMFGDYKENLHIPQLGAKYFVWEEPITVTNEEKWNVLLVSTIPLR